MIINVDDVGLSDAINGAAKECYLSGAITGVSVIACGRRFREACAVLRDLGKTETGVHLTLTGGLRPCTGDLSLINSLLRKNGTFVRGYMNLAVLYSLGRIAAGQIYLELGNQIKRLKEEGLRVTHLDSHEHIHMFPPVLKVAVTLAHEFDIPYIRLPREVPAVIRKRFSVRDLLRLAGLKAFTPGAERTISRAQVKCNAAFLGHFHSGRIDDDILCFMMKNLAEGVNELAVHPGVMSRELMDESPWHRNAPVELDALLNGRWRKIADSGKIPLISHREAVSFQARSGAGEGT